MARQNAKPACQCGSSVTIGYTIRDEAKTTPDEIAPHIPLGRVGAPRLSTARYSASKLSSMAEPYTLFRVRTSGKATLDPCRSMRSLFRQRSNA